ncbi:hypothetical protein MPL3356_110227 [Mesorhizobium plurifarium]|uniref:Uncharacterized protein n=1 Tax=Mesorhizobium plurifarium TaxID=69974 RepID=A0A090DA27_MESPL|nr:hypothetical protein MPL3356_110227 [Mesorhizobium plurifarium]
MHVAVRPLSHRPENPSGNRGKFVDDWLMLLASMGFAHCSRPSRVVAPHSSKLLVSMFSQESRAKLHRAVRNRFPTGGWHRSAPSGRRGWTSRQDDAHWSRSR